MNFSDVKWLRRNALWFIGPIVLAIVPFTDAFIPSYSTGANKVTGWAQPIYYGGLVVAYAVLLWDSLRSIKGLTGAPRLELQVWLVGGTAVVGIVYLLIGLSELTDDPIFRRIQPLAVLFFYAGTSYAITTHRIFDARQLVVLVAEKAILVVCVSGVAYVVYRGCGLILSETPAFLCATLVGLWFASFLGEWLDRTLKFFPQGLAARQAAFAAAQRERRVEDLERAYSALLKGWGQSDRALILSGSKGVLTGSGVSLESEGTVLRALRQ
ncbi:MAG: hypothetical protein V4773_13805, partial [Verrucomicrobiota bacterium]